MLSDSESAMNKVLGVIELLESVLVHVNTRTLLLSQRVSTNWNNVINGSMKLQKKLFFLPVKDIEEMVSLGSVEKNAQVIVWQSRSEPNTQPEVYLLNPLILQEDYHDAANTYDDTHDAQRSYWFPENIARDTISTRRGKSSWERMLISQPLVQPLGVKPQYYKIHPGGEACSSKKVYVNTHNETLEVTPSHKYLRDLMDTVEETNMQDNDVTIIWCRTRFEIWGRAMTYAEATEMK